MIDNLALQSEQKRVEFGNHLSHLISFDDIATSSELLTCKTKE